MLIFIVPKGGIVSSNYFQGGRVIYLRAGEISRALDRRNTGGTGSFGWPVSEEGTGEKRGRSCVGMRFRGPI